MIKLLKILIFISIIAPQCYIFANTADTVIEFKYYKYVFIIDTRSDDFFAGSLKVKENGKIVFSMDSTFTSYLDHKFIDFDNNGKKELAVYLTGGASPYIFHHLYIFDIENGPKPLYMIQNGEIDTTDKELPLLMLNSKMSPAVLGLWYNWYLQYRNGKLVYFKPDKKRKHMVRPDYDFVNESLKGLKDENITCDDFGFNVFFEYIFICSKIAGLENEAEEYFNKNYKCKDKTAALKNFKRIAAENFKWIKDEENYKYSDQ